MREITSGVLSPHHPVAANADARTMTLKKTSITKLIDSAIIYLPVSTRHIDYWLTCAKEKDAKTNVTLIATKVNTEKEDVSRSSGP